MKLTKNEISIVLDCLDKYYLETDLPRQESVEYNHTLSEAYKKLMTKEREGK